ncbi:hypothetical protein C8J56DRAFT_1059555 [Mycena floridula]|nr:hypothetical protein C8J56DRAFT_1059555 [Mycena floridula]
MIFSLLAPSDLLWMIVLNKSFYSTLQSPSANSIWKASRKAHGVPEPFEGFGEMDWIFFLFKESCDVCQREDDWDWLHNLGLDFMVMARLSLMRRETSLRRYKGDIQEDDEDFDEEESHYQPIMNWSRCSSSFRIPSVDDPILDAHKPVHKTDRYYLKKVIYAIYPVFKGYKADVDSGRPGALRNFQQYKQERPAYVARRFAKVCHDWLENKGRSKDEDLNLATIHGAELAERRHLAQSHGRRKLRPDSSNPRGAPL